MAWEICPADNLACPGNKGNYFPGCNRTCDRHPERVAAVQEIEAKQVADKKKAEVSAENFERVQTRALRATYTGDASSKIPKREDINPGGGIA